VRAPVPTALLGLAGELRHREHRDVQLFREDRDDETWFTTISYWSELDAMRQFTKGDPSKVHHLDRDPEFLIELPERIEIHRILVDAQRLR